MNFNFLHLRTKFKRLDYAFASLLLCVVPWLIFLRLSAVA